MNDHARIGSRAAHLLWRRAALAAVAAGAMLQSSRVWACAACYGQSDSPLAKGMNWGIFSLLGTVAVVLGTVASFFVYIGKRSSSATPPPVEKSGEPPLKP